MCMVGGMCGGGGHVHSGGHVWWGVHGGRWVWVAGGACVAGGMNGGVMHGQGGHAWQERWPLQQTVSILLEYIFVVSNDYMKVE